MADILFIIYLIFMAGVFWLCFSEHGKDLCYEYLAFKETQRFMHSKGLRWPPREWLD